ncbi:MAG TPA: cytochrome c [Candidatus Krumholzibacteria bacterium]|nr:cytochrome c [Candidatus Krumholzibacteria bacterium]
MFRHHRTSIALLIAVSVLGCEGARNNSSWSTAKPGDAIVPSLNTNSGTNVASAPAPATAPQAAATTSSGRGVGPVDHVDVASLDAARAMKGAELFTAKCSACHKMEERYIGPALTGVTKRRTPEWICNQILNPENMIQQDPTARALLAEYIAPMANQHLTREEAESVLAYFMQHDGIAAPAENEHDDTPDHGAGQTK